MSDQPQPPTKSDTWFAEAQHIAEMREQTQHAERNERVRALRWDILSLVDAARAADAATLQEKDAEIAALHQCLSGYEAVTDPEEYPDLFEESSELLGAGKGTCGNRLCAIITAKDAEIAELKKQRDRLKMALSNHLCEHDMADWLACAGGHGEGACDVCESAGEKTHFHDQLKAATQRIAALEDVVQLMKEKAYNASVYWDADQDSKVGKSLGALAGRSGYFVDLDEARKKAGL